MKGSGTGRASLRAAAKPLLCIGGDNEIRTRDLLLAKQALYQLSYVPSAAPSLVGLGRLELPTSRLSGVRSNQLSYKPN